MSNSLQDQLLQAGLISKKQMQANKQQKSKKQQPQRKKEKSQRQKELDAIAAHKREQDKALNEKREQQRKAKEQSDWVRQLLKNHEMVKASQAEDANPFHFSLVDKIHRLHVNEKQRKQLSSGQTGIVLYDGQYHLVPKEVAKRLAEKIPKRVWFDTGETDQPDEDDPYADYQVPDDLIW